jgi:hypothetical protein
MLQKGGFLGGLAAEDVRLINVQYLKRYRGWGEAEN